MAAAFMNHATAALRRGFLVMGVLAVVAGFLGMHIMTGIHGAHAMTGVTSSTESAGTSSQTAQSLASHPGAHDLSAVTTANDSIAPPRATPPGPGLTGNSRTDEPSATCACESSCTDPASMHSACVPSAAGTSLAAPPPGAAPTSIHTPDLCGNDAARKYSYMPASPSPGDLSISRT